MNRNEVRHAFSQESTGPIGGKLVVVLATVIFWLLMFALLSCPAWLPGLIEQSISH